MSLGLPAHIAPNAVRSALVNAQHAVVFTLLSISVLMVLVFQSAQPESSLWLSGVALLPMLGLLLVAGRMNIVLWWLSYLTAGGIGVYFYALGVFDQAIPVQYYDGFTLLPLKIALMLMGGVILGKRAGIAGAVVGYLTAELAVGVAQTHTAVTLLFDVPAFVTLIVSILIILIFGMKDPRQIWVLPRLQRAAYDEHLASLRNKIEMQAATVMHDTVLNHLTAIAASAAVSLDPMLRQQISRDVDSLTSEEWLAETTAKSKSIDRARTDWHESGLYAAISEARLMGLSITTSGELTAVSRLSQEASVALGLAAKQCLVNVLKHSGTRNAEVSVYSSDAEVSVMVVDSGCGFTESATGTDRLGLRSSVRKRIEIIGGAVRVWSAPGHGTSIMIRVPAQQDAGPSHTEATADDS